MQLSKKQKIFSELFVNTLSTDDMYSRCGYWNLQQPTQTQWSTQQNIFYESFTPFFKSPLSFKHFR